MNPFRRLAHRSTGLVVGLAAAAVWLAGCSSTDKPKPTPLESFTPSIAGSAVWQARLSGVDFPLVIQARADHFVAAGQDGTVLALNAASGQELWRGSAGSPLSAGVGYDGRFAAVVTRANELVVFEGGQERWRKRVAGRVLTAPLVAGERVFVLRADRGVQAFDVLDGRPLWTYQRPGEALLLAQGGVLAAYRNLLIVGQGSRLAALDPLRGTLRWETAVATPRGTNEVERLSELVGPVMRTGDTLCARAFQAAVGCVDAARGVLTWSRPNAGATAISGDADLMVGADATGRIATWRTPTGDVAWTHDRLLYRELSAPLLVGPVLVVGDLEGQVHFLARQDGATLQRLSTDGTPVVGAPVLSGTTVLVATRGGGLHAFRPQ